jgi:hypothetical protein
MLTFDASVDTISSLEENVARNPKTTETLLESKHAVELLKIEDGTPGEAYKVRVKAKYGPQIQRQFQNREAADELFTDLVEARSQALPLCNSLPSARIY